MEALARSLSDELRDVCVCVCAQAVERLKLKLKPWIECLRRLIRERREKL